MHFKFTGSKPALFPIFTRNILSMACAFGLYVFSLTAYAEDVDETFSFIALGDMPYGDPEKVYPPYETLIETINERQPDLVIHVGDTKGGGACTDEILADQLNYMNTILAPTLYTPGDNEWTDCARMTDGADDPIERLAHIRKTYFNEPDQSFGGNPIALEHQADEGYPENARVTLNKIAFITAHTVGSNNNLQATNIAAVKEFFVRSKASTRWLGQSFKKAQDADVIVIAIHADMFEFDYNEFEGERWLRHSGFSEFGPALQKAARQFDKPVLLVFGDSHEHRVFKPFPKYAPNVTAMEVYGYRDMHAVEVTIDTAEKEPFEIKDLCVIALFGDLLIFEPTFGFRLWI